MKSCHNACNVIDQILGALSWFHTYAALKNAFMSSDYIPRFFPNSLLPILNSCMKDRCGFLFVRYKRHCCTELVSWEHASCPLFGIEKRPLMGSWLNTSYMAISIGATASVRCWEVVRSWEGPLWEVLLYALGIISPPDLVLYDSLTTFKSHLSPYLY